MRRADYTFAHSQWETSLYSNAVSHWQGANLESALWQQSKLNQQFVIQYNTMRYDTIRYNTIQYNTIQYNKISFIFSRLQSTNNVSWWAAIVRLHIQNVKMVKTCIWKLRMEGRISLGTGGLTGDIHIPHLHDTAPIMENSICVQIRMIYKM